MRVRVENARAYATARQRRSRQPRSVEAAAEDERLASFWMTATAMVVVPILDRQSRTLAAFVSLPTIDLRHRPAGGTYWLPVETSGVRFIDDTTGLEARLCSFAVGCSWQEAVRWADSADGPDVAAEPPVVPLRCGAVRIPEALAADGSIVFERVPLDWPLKAYTRLFGLHSQPTVSSRTIRYQVDDDRRVTGTRVVLERVVRPPAELAVR